MVKLLAVCNESNQTYDFHGEDEYYLVIAMTVETATKRFYREMHKYKYFFEYDVDARDVSTILKSKPFNEFANECVDKPVLDSIKAGKAGVIKIEQDVYEFISERLVSDPARELDQTENDKTSAQTWIIGMSGSDWDNVAVERIYGTKDQIKQYLTNLVKDDAKDDSFDYGDTEIDDVEERGNGVLYAGSTFSDHHNDYTATPEMPVVMIEEVLNTKSP